MIAVSFSVKVYRILAGVPEVDDIPDKRAMAIARQSLYLNQGIRNPLQCGAIQFFHQLQHGNDAVHRRGRVEARWFGGFCAHGGQFQGHEPPLSTRSRPGAVKIFAAPEPCVESGNIRLVQFCAVDHEPTGLDGHGPRQDSHS